MPLETPFTPASAGNAQVILSPDIPYAIDKSVEHIKARDAFAAANLQSWVVAECAKPSGGDNEHPRHRESGARCALEAPAERIGTYLCTAPASSPLARASVPSCAAAARPNRDPACGRCGLGAAAVAWSEQGSSATIVAYHARRTWCCGRSRTAEIPR